MGTRPGLKRRSEKQRQRSSPRQFLSPYLLGPTGIQQKCRPKYSIWVVLMRRKLPTRPGLKRRSEKQRQRSSPRQFLCPYLLGPTGKQQKFRPKYLIWVV